jgi:hypothetical protein
MRGPGRKLRTRTRVKGLGGSDGELVGGFGCYGDFGEGGSKGVRWVGVNAGPFGGGYWEGEICVGAAGKREGGWR